METLNVFLLGKLAGFLESDKGNLLRTILFHT